MTNPMMEKFSSVAAGRPLLWLTLVGVCLAGLAAGLWGCAARQPSSTDRHGGPQPYCQIVKLNGSLRNVCCIEDRCWFAD
jgi:hypothetical protein